MKIITLIAFAGLVVAELSVAAKAASTIKKEGKEAAISRSFSDPTLRWGPGPQFMPNGVELAILHGDPAKPNADAFLKIPPNVKIPNHWHTSSERMILVQGQLNINYESQPPVNLNAGGYAFGPAKLRHDAVCVSSSPCVLFIAFAEPIDAIPVTDISKK